MQSISRRAIAAAVAGPLLAASLVAFVLLRAPGGDQLELVAAPEVTSTAAPIGNPPSTQRATNTPAAPRPELDRPFPLNIEPIGNVLLGADDPAAHGQPFLYNVTERELKGLNLGTGRYSLSSSPFRDVLLASTDDGRLLIDLELGTAQRLRLPGSVRNVRWLDDQRLLVSIGASTDVPGDGWQSGQYEIDLLASTITYRSRQSTTAEPQNKALRSQVTALFSVAGRAGSGARIFDSRWSSDEKRVAHRIGGGESNYGYGAAWILDITSPQPVRGPYERFEPFQWQPNGTLLLGLANYCVTGGFNPAIIDSATGEVRVNRDIAGVWGLEWSADGNAIVASAVNIVHIIDPISLVGAELPPFGTWSAGTTMDFPGDAHWSASGRWLFANAGGGRGRCEGGIDLPTSR